MLYKDLLPYLVTLIASVITGVLSFITSTNKSKKELQQLQEQNKHDLEKLINQHKMDLEGLELKHKQEIERMEIDHNHKIELMQKETENKLGGEIFGNMLSGVINSPEIKSKMNQSILQGLSKKKK